MRSVTLYSAQQQLQTVRLLRLQNLVTLYKALGGGLREHAAAAQRPPREPRRRPLRTRPAWV